MKKNRLLRGWLWFVVLLLLVMFSMSRGVHPPSTTVTDTAEAFIRHVSLSVSSSLRERFQLAVIRVRLPSSDVLVSRIDSSGNRTEHPLSSDPFQLFGLTRLICGSRLIETHPFPLTLKMLQYQTLPPTFLVPVTTPRWHRIQDIVDVTSLHPMNNAEDDHDTTNSTTLTYVLVQSYTRRVSQPSSATAPSSTTSSSAASAPFLYRSGLMTTRQMRSGACRLRWLTEEEQNFEPVGRVVVNGRRITGNMVVVRSGRRESFAASSQQHQKQQPQKHQHKQQLHTKKHRDLVLPAQRLFVATDQMHRFLLSERSHNRRWRKSNAKAFTSDERDLATESEDLNSFPYFDCDKVTFSDEDVRQGFVETGMTLADKNKLFSRMYSDAFLSSYEQARSQSKTGVNNDIARSFAGVHDVRPTLEWVL